MYTRHTGGVKNYKEAELVGTIIFTFRTHAFCNHLSLILYVYKAEYVKRVHIFKHTEAQVG